MSGKYKKPYRKRNRWKMKAKHGPAFHYGVGRQGRGAAYSPQSATSKDLVRGLLQRMGFKGE